VVSVWRPGGDPLRGGAAQRGHYLNYSAVDPALTNDKCHYWHFRFDANADMKMAALTDVHQDQPQDQEDLHHRAGLLVREVVAEAAVAMLKQKRPDIQIVGNELHPIGKVQDFSPYVQKIVASGADAVITGNWGADSVKAHCDTDSVLECTGAKGELRQESSHAKASVKRRDDLCPVTCVKRDKAGNCP